MLSGLKLFSKRKAVDTLGAPVTEEKEVDSKPKATSAATTVAPGVTVPPPAECPMSLYFPISRDLHARFRNHELTAENSDDQWRADLDKDRAWEMLDGAEGPICTMVTLKNVILNVTSEGGGGALTIVGTITDQMEARRTGLTCWRPFPIVVTEASLDMGSIEVNGQWLMLGALNFIIAGSSTYSAAATYLERFSGRLNSRKAQGLPMTLLLEAMKLRGFFCGTDFYFIHAHLVPTCKTDWRSYAFLVSYLSCLRA